MILRESFISKSSVKQLWRFRPQGEVVSPLFLLNFIGLFIHYEAFAREMILVPGKAKMRAKREFTVVNDRLSRACPASRASALGTFLTLHGSKMALVQRSHYSGQLRILSS